jgi:CRISPR-associated protein Cas6
MNVDCLFPISGETLPLEHGYALFGALSRVVPAFHEADAGLRFTPVTGEPGPRGRLSITRYSRLQMRLEAERIALVLPLAGRTLTVQDCSIRLGAPTVLPLLPSAALWARIVTFKNSTEPEGFLTHAREQLIGMGVRGEPGIPLIQEGERAGQPQRRVLRIKGTSIIGYALQVEGLTAEESIALQERGFGGRSRIGCGFFVPLTARA